MSGLRALVLLALFIGSGLITATSLPHLDPEELSPFVVEKLPVRFEAAWLAALRLHVVSAALALPLCLALSTRALQRRAGLHRVLGRVAAAVLLLALVPSGAVLAIDAKGGLAGTLGFLLSGAIVVAATLHGVATARRRDLVGHRRAMHHVLAQLSVAVTSRALLLLLDAASVDPDTAYVAALWGPVLASALVVELFSARSPRRADPSPRKGPPRRAHAPLAHRLVPAPRAALAAGPR
ncbi:MAG: DUF2306 domain-containing protein, partial [Deltaproteobacteria bacterium]|nr:DUF2306 domain-containing protein [Deltaproteobacteria bacterium]